VTGEFHYWLILVGLIAGAALTWLVMSETTRRDEEIGERELEAEAAWIANTLGDPLVDAEVAEHVLRAHRRYLGFPPPDALVDPDELVALEQAHGATAGDAGPASTDSVGRPAS
jgi:hypothetical protein